MTTFDALLDQDANGYKIQGETPFLIRKRITFAGGTTNDPGDYDGTGNPATIFTITGDVMIGTPFYICKTDLEGALATLALGVTGLAEKFIAHGTVTATDVNVGYAFNVNGGDIALPYTNTATVFEKSILSNIDIIQTVGTANITAGVIDYYLFWRPLSSDGRVTAG